MQNIAAVYYRSAMCWMGAISDYFTDSLVHTATGLRSLPLMLPIVQVVYRERIETIGLIHISSALLWITLFSSSVSCDKLARNIIYILQIGCMKRINLDWYNPMHQNGVHCLNVSTCIDNQFCKHKLFSRVPRYNIARANAPSTLEILHASDTNV